MIKAVISGYGRMGHMVEAALEARGIAVAGASEDIASFDRAIAGECVCIDFTTPDAFRANYKALADNFKIATIQYTNFISIFVLYLPDSVRTW